MKTASTIKGFTLIELIAVIILLGILSINVIPKFFTSKGFEEVTYRNEVVSTLRAIQLRAMQQTSIDANGWSNICHQVAVTSKQLGLIGTDPAESDNCSSTWQCTKNVSTDTCTSSTFIDDNHAVSFSTNASSNEFYFDQMGRPTNCHASESCQVIISGLQSFTVQIEAEGYIHAL